MSDEADACVRARGNANEPCRLRADAHVYAGEPSHPHARADVNALARDDCVGDYGRAACAGFTAFSIGA